MVTSIARGAQKHGKTTKLNYNNAEQHTKMTEEANTINFVIYAITGTHTDNPQHFVVPISYVSGVTTPFSNSTNVVITFTVTGDKGDQGISGFSGASGYSGFSGYSGISGYSGFSGQSGFSGISGFSGFSGISGFSGYSGISGFSVSIVTGKHNTYRDWETQHIS